MSEKEKPPKYQLLTSSEHVDTPRSELTSGALLGGVKENTTAHGIPHIARARGQCNIHEGYYWLSENLRANLKSEIFSEQSEESSSPTSY